MKPHRQSHPPNEETASLAVRGWQQSKASTTSNDGGVESLKTFLSKKASRPIQSAYVKGDALIISVKASDEHRFTHLNNFTWAGITLSVTQKSNTPSFGNQNNQQHGPSGPRNNTQRFGTPQDSQPRNNRFGNNNNNSKAKSNGDNVTMGSSPFDQPKGQTNSEQDAISQVMASVVRKRYNAAQKYLTLEALAADPEFIQAGLSASTASKVFAALFTTVEKRVFETPDKRRQMVESLSLSANGLTSVKDVIAASSTFAHIKNLDLGNNNIADVSELRFWKNRFRNLEHLILTGNPVALKPDTKDTLRRWYPKLQLYNNEPVRDIGTGMASSQTNNNNNNNNFLQTSTPQTTSPVYPLPTEPHPEFPADSTFGVAVPGKSEEQVLKEQMGLKFSYETRLKMQYVELCLTANNFNYEAALADLQNSLSAGNIPADAFLQV